MRTVTMSMKLWTTDDDSDDDDNGNDSVDN
jgi:hypothetical protein